MMISTSSSGDRNHSRVSGEVYAVGSCPPVAPHLELLAFLWALRSGQFEDLEGAAYRALEDDPPRIAQAQNQVPQRE
jgi:nitrogen fixation-related uncharacterized protein